MRDMSSPKRKMLPEPGGTTPFSALRRTRFHLPPDRPDQRPNPRLDRRPAHPPCPARGPQPVKAPDGGNQEPEQKRLDQSLQNVGEPQILVGHREVLRPIL